MPMTVDPDTGLPRYEPYIAGEDPHFLADDEKPEDIVERLRACSGLNMVTCREAADEIERLRKSIEQLGMQLKLLARQIANPL